MINILKLIQIIICVTLIIPSVCIFIKEIFNKNASIKKKRLIISSFVFLLSLFIFFVLSIFICYNDDLYTYLKYAPFIQSWIIVKCTLATYFELFVFSCIMLGLYFWIILIFEKIIIKSFVLVDFKKSIKLTFRQKLQYPFMWYEMHANVKKINNKYILSHLAFNELTEFENKEDLDE